METVARNMGTAIPLFYPIVMLNRDSDNQQIFFDIPNGCAICGFRRTVANWGVLLIRAQYARGAEVDLDRGSQGIMHQSGNWHYTKETYNDGACGIIGKDISDGKERELVDNETALGYINTIKERAALRYSVDLCPNEIHRFANDHYTGFRHTAAYQDKKINFHFTAGFPAGHLQGMAERDVNGDIIMVSQFEFKGKTYNIKSYVDKDSLIPLQKIQLGRVYLIKPKEENKQTGDRTCNVLQTYKSGIRLAIQHFDRGLFRPGSGSYDVTKSDTNNVKFTMDHPFMPDYDDKWIAGAPMISFDLDMFASLMNTLKGYPRVSMQFRDSSSGAYFHAKGHNELPDIEAIVGQTILYVRGRIWTP
jgi:hypothetical protein